ncbi:MAG: alpha/beta hydrolase [Bacteriovoracia bacterium]
MGKRVLPIGAIVSRILLAPALLITLAAGCDEVRTDLDVTAAGASLFQVAEGVHAVELSEKGVRFVGTRRKISLPKLARAIDTDLDQPLRLTAQELGQPYELNFHRVVDPDADYVQMKVWSDQNQLLAEARLPYTGTVPRGATRWEPSRLSSGTKAVALVAHGLNTSPQKMSAITDFLTERGVSCLRVSLSGHHGDFGAREKINRDVWLAEMRAAYREARINADGLQAPLYLVGFSLGALLNLDLMENDPAGTIRYDKLVLFAPAIQNKSPDALIGLAHFLTGDDGTIPSLNLPEYRANSSTGVTMYAATIESEKALNKTGFSAANVPTLVFMDSKDELVSYKKIKKLVASPQLDQWRLVTVTNQGSTLRKKYHHLIIDAATVGDAQWQAMKAAMENHLGI